MINNAEFSKFNIDKISLFYGHDHDYGNILRYQFLDKNNKAIKKSFANIYELTDQLDDKLDTMSGFELEQISIQLKDDESVELSLDKKFEDKFINLMLSKDLISILEHSELQNTLSTKEIATKKLKV